ncbi:uncharacterized protein LOC128291743 [Gossypium arboreum]|uniref:uncharacterized protein LOC128291743 n=1 Tax=Gossypium arboreum TaxID=29729 RepID=UPI0022F1712E|nr:uncharacterized protein LOC128291743 [Gossypium arboreum]
MADPLPESEPEQEPKQELEAKPEPDPEPEAEPKLEGKPKPDPEPEPKPETEPELGTEPKSDPELEPESEPKPEPEPESKPEPQLESESESQPETEPASEWDSGWDSDLESYTQSESETELELPIPITIRYEMNTESRFFLCSHCGNHVVSMDNCVVGVEGPGVNGIICHNPINVESDDISRSKIVLYQRAVNVYCIACNGAVGERFTELTPPYPRIMEGSYLLRRNWMLYWNGTQLRQAIGAVDDRPP